MKAIDEIHLEQPFRGSRRIRDELVDRGVTAKIKRKKVQRLIQGHKWTAKAVGVTMCLWNGFRQVLLRCSISCIPASRGGV
jgi:hypothetical protein